MTTCFPFYDSLSMQTRFKRQCIGESVFSLPTLPNRFPPFIIYRNDTGKLIECITLYDLNNEVIERIDPTKVDYKKYTTSEGMQYLVYYGSTISDLTMPCGQCYLDIDGFVSEVFSVRVSMANLLRIQFRHNRDLGNIPYHTGFEQSIYLDTYLLEPDYSKDEEVSKNGFDREIPIFQKLEKLYKLETLLIPEYVCDVLQTLFLHKYIRIVDVNGDLYEDIYNVSVKTDWFGSACFGTTEVSFVQTAIISRHMEKNLTLVEIDRTGEEYKPWVCSNEPNPFPIWEWDLATLRCLQTDSLTRTVSTRVAKKKDNNPDSVTNGQYQNSGEEFVYDTNATECPLASDPLPLISLSGPSSMLIGTEYTLTATASDDKTLIAESVEFFYQFNNSPFMSIGKATAKNGASFTIKYTPTGQVEGRFKAVVTDSALQAVTSNVVTIPSSFLDNLIKVDVVSTINKIGETTIMTISAVLRNANGELTTAPDNITVGYKFNFYGGTYPSGTGTLVVGAGQNSASIQQQTNQPVSYGNGVSNSDVPPSPSISGGRTVQY